MAAYISGLKEATRRKIFRLIYDKAVDNWITLNTSSGLDNPMHLDICH